MPGRSNAGNVESTRRRVGLQSQRRRLDQMHSYMFSFRNKCNKCNKCNKLGEPCQKSFFSYCNRSNIYNKCNISGEILSKHEPLKRNSSICYCYTCYTCYTC